MRRLALFAVFIGCFWSAAPVMAAETADSIPRFVGFPVIIVNTSDGINYNGLFSLKVQLQVKDEAAHDRAEALRPQLQDALTEASFRLGQLYVDPRKPVPWARLMRELDTAVKRVMPNSAARVLILEMTTRATS
jgi:hypothetical protein